MRQTHKFTIHKYSFFYFYSRSNQIIGISCFFALYVYIAIYRKYSKLESHNLNNPIEAMHVML